MNENIIAGLISGAVVTLFIIIFRSIWIKIIEPWFEDRVYKDAQIEGKWFTLYLTTIDNRQEVASLIRHGHEISGHLICTQGDDKGEKYIVSGSFRNMILPLIYEASDRTRSDRGTMTLMLTNNAERLIGMTANYDTQTDRITTNPMI